LIVFHVRLAIAALLLSGPAGLVMTSPNEARGEPSSPFTAGVVAPSGKVLFLPGAGGGIEAVPLFNGKTLWRSPDANRPLLATADELFALAEIKGKRNQVRIVTFDAVTGERLRRSQVITLPDWVSVPTAHGRSFRCTALKQGKRLLFVWEATSWRDGGPMPVLLPGEKDPAERQDAGGVRIHQTSGKVTPLKGYRPKKGIFPSTDTGTGKTLVGDWWLKVEEDTRTASRSPFVVRRVLKAQRVDGKGSWTHELAGRVELPPRS
jgi:hypothetical protein